LSPFASHAVANVLKQFYANIHEHAQDAAKAYAERHPGGVIADLVNSDGSAAAPSPDAAPSGGSRRRLQTIGVRGLNPVVTGTRHGATNPRPRIVPSCSTTDCLPVSVDPAAPAGLPELAGELLRRRLAAVRARGVDQLLL
jgi:hypothetical protein